MKRAITLIMLAISLTGCTFIDQDDTPNSYTGQAGKYIGVNTDENGLIYLSGTSSGDGNTTDTTLDTNASASANYLATEHTWSAAQTYSNDTRQNFRDTGQYINSPLAGRLRVQSPILDLYSPAFNIGTIDDSVITTTYTGNGTSGAMDWNSAGDYFRYYDTVLFDKNISSKGDVNGLRLCIKSDCRTVWPEGGGVSRADEGANIDLNANMGDITISVDDANLALSFYKQGDLNNNNLFVKAVDLNNLGDQRWIKISDSNNIGRLDYQTIANPPWVTSTNETKLFRGANIDVNTNETGHVLVSFNEGNWTTNPHTYTAMQTFNGSIATNSTTLITNLNADFVDSIGVGSSGSAIPNMAANNAWSGAQTFTNRTTVTSDLNKSFTVENDSGSDVLWVDPVSKLFDVNGSIHAFSNIRTDSTVTALSLWATQSVNAVRDVNASRFCIGPSCVTNWNDLDGNGGGGTPAGSDQEFQFNNTGSFGADSQIIRVAPGEFQASNAVYSSLLYATSGGPGTIVQPRSVVFETGGEGLITTEDARLRIETSSGATSNLDLNKFGTTNTQNLLADGNVTIGTGDRFCLNGSACTKYISISGSDIIIRNES